MVADNPGLPKSRLEEIISGPGEMQLAPCIEPELAGEGPLSPELVKLAEQLLKLLGPTAEAGVQTGGPKEAGRVVRGGPQGRVPKASTTKDIVSRIRISYSALRAARVDGALRQLLLAELITQTYNEGGSLVVP